MRLCGVGEEFMDEVMGVPFFSDLFFISTVHEPTHFTFMKATRNSGVFLPSYSLLSPEK